MKFNPPCYSVTFELLESLTDSSVEKASLCAVCVCAFMCLRDRVCVALCVCVHVCLNFYSCDSQSEFKEWGTFFTMSFPYYIKGPVYGQGLN